MTRVIHVAVGVVVGVDGRILVARRPPDVHQGDLWEFPGGKLEEGETVLDALQRELQEELDIVIDSEFCFPLKKISHQYDDRSVLLDVWRVDRFQGSARGRENQEIAWRGIGELLPADFPAANREIINTLQLPALLAITGQASGYQDFLGRFEKLLASGMSLVQLRQPGLADDEYVSRAAGALGLCRDRDVQVLINGSLEVHSRLEGCGYHATSDRLMKLTSRPVAQSCLFSASCHTLPELVQAERLGVDFALLSPVSKTGSHPRAEPLGWDRFRELASRVSIPVYALGGLSPADLTRARREGGHGIAAISAFW